MRASLELPSQLPGQGGVRLEVTRPAPPIRVFLVEDHVVVRDGLTAVLEQGGDFKVVGEAGSAEQTLDRLPGCDPEVIVMDYRLPGMSGDDLCRELAQRQVRAEVVILTAFMDDDIVHACLSAGARAFVTKDVGSDELKRAIRGAVKGETFIDPKVAERVVGWGTRLSSGGKKYKPVLRPAEMRLLRLLGDGKSNEAIAEKMDVSIETVKSRLRRLYAKLEVKSRSEAVAIAFRRGLV
jgi:DNA-binding NarL/FixJ family response regulator